MQWKLRCSRAQSSLPCSSKWGPSARSPRPSLSTRLPRSQDAGSHLRTTGFTCGMGVECTHIEPKFTRLCLDLQFHSQPGGPGPRSGTTVSLEDWFRTMDHSGSCCNTRHRRGRGWESLCRLRQMLVCLGFSPSVHRSLCRLSAQERAGLCRPSGQMEASSPLQVCKHSRRPHEVSRGVC